MQNIKQEPPKRCAACSEILLRKQFNGRLESINVFLRRKYCNRGCMAAAMVKPVVKRQTYLQRARPRRLDHCEICQASGIRLTIHHKNRIWSDNQPGNLQTLCSSCHTSLHHASGEISKRLEQRPCESCGLVGLRKTCNTCRSRIKRYGADLVKQLGPNFYWRRAFALIPRRNELTA
jgi:hypothetical protein